MSKLLLVQFFMVLFFISILLIIIYKKKNIVQKKIKFISSLLQTHKEQKYNPDINTENWDLHKIRLHKFGRSQYKGLTFFISSEGRVYYLSENATKIYC